MCNIFHFSEFISPLLRRNDDKDDDDKYDNIIVTVMPYEVSGFGRSVVEVTALLRFYTLLLGSNLTTLRNSVLVTFQGPNFTFE